MFMAVGGGGTSSTEEKPRIRAQLINAIRRLTMAAQPIPDWNDTYQSIQVFSAKQVSENTQAPTWLVIMGEIYDVTGSEHYKQDSGYHIFVGKDATLAFVTGDFGGTGEDTPRTEIDDVSALTPIQLKSVETWVDFYRKHDVYNFVGVMHGRYYNASGHRTPAWQLVRQRMNLAKEDEARKKELERKYPICNSKWTQEHGSTVWCDDGNPLVPRQFKSILGFGVRCACVDVDKLAPDMASQFTLYEKCADTPRAKLCKL